MQKARLIAAVIALAGAWYCHDRAAEFTESAAEKEPVMERPDPFGQANVIVPFMPDEDRAPEEARFMRTLMYICGVGAVLILGRVAWEYCHQAESQSLNDRTESTP